MVAANEMPQTSADIRQVPQNDDSDSNHIIHTIAVVGSIILVIITFPISIFLCFKIVQEYERAVIFRLGRVREGGPRGPGLFFILPCIDVYAKVDLRTVSFDVPPQEVMSKDSVTLHVDAVVYYRVDSPVMATNNVSNYR
ncbi:hypothetical protein M8J76_009856 [Diaphorina citri]|nr:hypothetical protein M8J77_002563 [Diaphorina citri]KAI5704028.1 hypothetical protein M8J75_001228 [Diaphorina citri]KAI5737075.1 hypothetical protein M8J76_009856 [Diaphorina citri]KAI5743065.1 hypothetical protein M8J77_014084 [Diaphorina citri]